MDVDSVRIKLERDPEWGTMVDSMAGESDQGRGINTRQTEPK